MLQNLGRWLSQLFPYPAGTGPIKGGHNDFSKGYPFDRPPPPKPTGK